MKLPPSELAWTLVHYQAAGADVPDRIRSNPEITEGEMMSDEEIEEFIKDSIATLRILSDRHSPRLASLEETFRADLAYLVTLGRLDDDDYNDLTNQSNLRF